MSSEYANQDLHDIASQAEADLNTNQAKQGLNNTGVSTQDSGVDDSVTSRFPGSSVTEGSAASGAGNNREIPPEEGGDVDARGRMSKAGDFEGEGGPETKAEKMAQENPGDDSVRGNVRN